MGDIDRINRLSITDSTVESLKELRQKIQRRQEADEKSKNPKQGQDQAQEPDFDSVDLHDVSNDEAESQEVYGPKLPQKPGTLDGLDISA